MMCDRVSKSSTVGVGAIGCASLGGMCFLGGMAEAMFGHEARTARCSANLKQRDLTTSI